MQKFTEPRHRGEHVISEANGSLSREEGVLVTGQNLVVGTVLGKITASGSYTAFNQDASDGSQVAAGVLYGAVDASTEDKPCVVHVRSCELMAQALTWPADITGPEQLQAQSEMAALDIILR
ncbi:MAG: head decoration protein [Pseudomonadota bacterium]